MRITTKVVENFKVKVLQSPSSIFTREDVIGLLTNLSQSLETVPSEPSDLETRILDRIEEVVNSENIDYNVDLELNGFELSCSYDTSDLISSIRSMVVEEFESESTE